MNPDITAAIDKRLEDALANSNYRITLNLQKQNAKLKLERDLTYATNGGIFSVSPELISFVHTLISMGKENGILLDVNKNPVELPNLQEFLDNLIERYYECMNEYLVEFKSIQKARTTKALVG
jgi:hypothetical protein